MAHVDTYWGLHPPNHMGTILTVFLEARLCCLLSMLGSPVDGSLTSEAVAQQAVWPTDIWWPALRLHISKIGLCIEDRGFGCSWLRLVHWNFPSSLSKFSFSSPSHIYISAMDVINKNRLQKFECLSKWHFSGSAVKSDKLMCRKLKDIALFTIFYRILQSFERE